MKLTGQLVVVTGGGRGVGRAIAQACALEGAHVVIVARSATDLRETADIITGRGGIVEVSVADVTDGALALRLAADLVARFGRIDLLVNNAGRFKAIGPAWDCDPDAWFDDIRTNLFGTHLWTRAVTPWMLKQQGGRIVNLIGGGTYGPFEYGSAYGVSKAAVARYTETLSVELADRGPKVFAVDPGLVRTDMVEHVLAADEGHGWFRWMRDELDNHKDPDPSQVARLVVEIASGRLDALAGRALYHDDDIQLLEGHAREIVERSGRTLRMVN